MDRVEEEQQFIEHWKQKIAEVCAEHPERRRELGREALAALLEFDHQTTFRNPSLTALARFFRENEFNLFE